MLILQRKVGTGGSGGSGGNSWDLTSPTYNGYIDVNALDGGVRGMTMNPTGTKLYISGNSTHKIYQLELSTAWDVSTAVHSGVFLTVNTEVPMSSAYGVSFKPDGTRVYLINDDRVAYQLDLSVAWDISTAVYNSVNSGAMSGSQTWDITLNDTGTKVYLADNSARRIYQHNLSTAWDISSDSAVGSVLIPGGASGARGVSISSDGAEMFVFTNNLNGPGNILHYTLSTPFLITSATLTNSYIPPQFTVGTDPEISQTYCDVFVSPDGTKMVLAGYLNSSVFSYTL